MDVALLIRRRLKELRLEQRDLARVANVTESYVSQLLAGKKSPPAPQRTDIYDKMGALLKLSKGELSRLAEIQRKEDAKKKVAEPPVPLFRDFRELVLRKCNPVKRRQIRGIFGKEPFGELERLTTQKLLDVAKGIARQELDSKDWLRLVARLGGQSHRQLRVTVLEFLDTDVFDVSLENCIHFLDPLIESWDIDLDTFAIEVVLNSKLADDPRKRFEFTESEPQAPPERQPGLEEFLKDAALGGDVSEEEVTFMRTLRFGAKQPTPLYYYRVLQNLRDPLHFHPLPGEQKTASNTTGTTVKTAAKRKTATRGVNRIAADKELPGSTC